MRNKSFNLAQPFLGTEVTVTVDRPLGTKHPKHAFIYEVNYGFLKGVEAPDGEDLDAYVLGVATPLDSFKGVCVAIVHRKDDDDDKLVVVPESHLGISDEEIVKQTYFQEQWFDSLVVRE